MSASSFFFSSSRRFFASSRLPPDEDQSGAAAGIQRGRRQLDGKRTATPGPRYFAPGSLSTLVYGWAVCWAMVLRAH
jgi:hypothetical protein